MLKQTLLILSFLFGTLQLRAAEAILSGKIHSIKKYHITLCTPVNGFANPRTFANIREEDILVTNDSFYCRIEVPEYHSFVNLFIDYVDGTFAGRITVMVKPGDRVILFGDLERNDEDRILFKGDNAKGNQLLTILESSPLEKYRTINNLLEFSLQKQKIETEEVDSVVNTLITPYTKAYNQRQISFDYYRAIQKYLRFFTYRHVILNFSMLKSKKTVSLPISLKLETAERLFQKMPISDTTLKGFNHFTSYANEYYMLRYFKEKNVIDIGALENSSRTITIRDSTIKIDGLLNIPSVVTNDSLKIHIWAFYLANALRIYKGHFNESILAQYDLLFPNNNYSVLLERELSTYSKESGTKFSSVLPITLIDSAAEFKTFSDLMKQYFPKKKVYVDLWATWCAPCITEFAFNPSLDSFLLKNSIERLYISLDNPGNRKQWLKDIEKYQLGGRHVLASKELITDIAKDAAIDNKNGFPIPRYLIISESGKIAVKDALRPSDGKMLTDQLSTF